MNSVSNRITKIVHGNMLAKAQGRDSDIIDGIIARLERLLSAHPLSQDVVEKVSKDWVPKPIMDASLMDMMERDPKLLETYVRREYVGSNGAMGSLVRDLTITEELIDDLAFLRALNAGSSLFLLITGRFAHLEHSTGDDALSEIIWAWRPALMRSYRGGGNRKETMAEAAVLLHATLLEKERNPEAPVEWCAAMAGVEL